MGTKRGVMRVMLFHFGDWTQGYKIMKPLIDVCKPYVLTDEYPDGIHYKNFTDWAGFAKKLDWNFHGTWTYPISRFLQIKDIVPDESGEIPIVRTIYEFLKTNCFICTVEISGGNPEKIISRNYETGNPVEKIYYIV